jgi:hypothetical protein
MSFWNSTLMNNLVNDGELPEMPVSVSVSASTWVQLLGVVVVIICLVISGVLIVNSTK